MTSTQDSKESTALVNTEDYDTQISLAAEELNALAKDADDDIKLKLTSLANLTQPTIKGVEGSGPAKIPRVMIRQASSSSDTLPSTCQLGQMYDSQAQLVGNELKFIPILQHVIRVKWTPDGGSSLDCMSLDGQNGSRYGKCSACPHGRYDPGARPACSKGNRFYVVTEDLTALYQIDFMKTSVKAGRNILKLTTPPALWARSFELSTEKQTGNNRTYYTFKTQPTGTRTSPQMMAICEVLHKGFYATYQRGLALQAHFATQFNGGDVAIDVSGGQIEINDDENGSIDFSGSM